MRCIRLPKDRFDHDDVPGLDRGLHHRRQLIRRSSVPAAQRLRQGIVETGHVAAAGEDAIDPRRHQRIREFSVHARRLGTKFQHIPQYSDSLSTGT